MKRIPWEMLGVATGAVAAVALGLGTSQPSEAAASPSPGWHTFNAAIGDSSLSGIYAVSASDAWAASEGPSGGKVLHFTGTAWESVTSPDVGALEAISGTSDRDIWVLGATSAAHWNGSSWKSSSLVIPAGAAEGSDANLLYDAGANDVYAVVSYSATHGTAAGESLEHFNGKAWTAVTSLPGVSADSSIITDLTGGGPDDIYLSATQAFTTKSELLQFNGHAWSAVQLPGSPTGPQVEVTGAGRALALGTTSSGTNSVGYAAQLSGGKWTKVSLPASNNVPSTGASGSGTAWADLVDYPAETVWAFSSGKWTQIKATSTQASGLLYGAADGSSVWAVSGNETDLYVG